MRYLVLLISGLVSLTVAAEQISVPNEFVSGEKAVAADVNENFAAVVTGVNNNDTAIATKLTNTIQSCDAGSAIRSIDTEGNVECEADDVGGDSSAGDIGANTTAIGVNAAAIQVNTDAIATKQTSLKNSCPAGQFIMAIAADGTATCADDLQGSAASATDIETNKTNIAANLVKITANTAANEKNAEDIKINAGNIADKQPNLTATNCGSGEILTSIDPATGVGVCKALAIPVGEVTSSTILDSTIKDEDISGAAKINRDKIDGDAGMEFAPFTSATPNSVETLVATNLVTVTQGGYFMITFAGDAKVGSGSRVELTIKGFNPKALTRTDQLTRFISNSNAATIEIPFNAAWAFVLGDKVTSGGTFKFEAYVKEVGTGKSNLSNISFLVLYVPKRY